MKEIKLDAPIDELREVNNAIDKTQAEIEKLTRNAAFFAGMMWGLVAGIGIVVVGCVGFEYMCNLVNRIGF